MTCSLTLHLYNILVELMEDFGRGYCKKALLRSKDENGIDSQEACNLVCLAEPDCMFSSFRKGVSCSRYGNAGCKLHTVATNYATYKKIVGGTIT